MNKTVLDLFGKALVTDTNISLFEMNKMSLLRGYIVHPSVCNQEVFDWINDKPLDYNSTFYKSWNDVISKNRFELYIDQIRHYASTYGTDYTGEVYIPNDGSDKVEFKSFKVITPISVDELKDKCDNMVYANIAYKEDTIKNLLLICNGLNHKLDLSKVKNKELQIRLHIEYGTKPDNATELLRFFIFQSTQKSLIIKNKELITNIKESNLLIDVNEVEKQILASIFYRYKPLFLAFKSNPKNTHTINQIRRLAKKYHTPMVVGFFESLLSSPGKVDKYVLMEKLKTISNFKKIALLQTISIRLEELSNRVFIVRNQKLFIKEGKIEVSSADKAWYETIFACIYTNLIETLSTKACKIRLPEGVNITLPTSEKNFIGNYPIGTSFNLSDSNCIVGINWKSSDGAHDLDLKLIDLYGNDYGWNTNYYNNDKSIIFSGDMTSANPEATELFYTKKGFLPSIVKVNLYNGAVDSKFRFFIAKENIKKMKHNYMVNPNNILFSIECKMDSNEKSLGIITDNKFILAELRTGNKIVSRESITNLYTDYALSISNTYLRLDKVLTDAGFIISDDKPDIDLTELSKDSLIALLN
jgi:hypothetical protein